MKREWIIKDAIMEKIMKNFLFVLLLLTSAVISMDKPYAHEYVMRRAQMRQAQQQPMPTTVTTRHGTRTFAPDSELKFERDPQGGQIIKVYDSWWRKVVDKPIIIHD